MKPEPKNIPDLVSIIYASYNRKNDLLNALRDIQHQTYQNLEIIVVDNGSTDGTAEAIKTQYPSLHLIELEENLGCPSGRNVGMRVASGEFIATLDDDAELEPTAIEKAVNLLKKHPDVAIVTGKVINTESNQAEYWQFNSDPAYMDKYFFTYYFGELCSLLRKSALDQVGLYPDNFFRQSENRDLGNRILDAGYKILYFPDFLVFHNGGSKSLLEYYYEYRNKLFIYIKQYHIRRIFFLSIPLSCLYFYRFLKYRQPLLIFKAWKDLINEWPVLMNERRVLRNTTIKNINQLKKYVHNLPRYYSKVSFKP